MQLRVLGLLAIFLLFSTTALPAVISYTSSTSCAAEVTDSAGHTTILTDTGVSSFIYGAERNECRVFPGGSRPYAYEVEGATSYESYREHSSVETSGSAYPNGSFSASVDVTLEFTSAGPPRDGFALLWLTTRGDLGTPDTGGSSVTVTDFTGRTWIFDRNNCPDGICLSWDPLHSLGPDLVPFRLGVPFQTRLRSSAQLFPYSSGRKYFGAHADIWLYEADGVTFVPAADIVPVGEVPEPQTILLTAAGLLMLLVARFCIAAMLIDL
jgi:hypothetical protein